MFDGLLGSKFSNKCKNKLKCIKSRIGPIKNKKQTIVRIQRKDVADLLAAGEQEKAITRIDALSTDMNLVDCYEMIEQYCEFIQSQLPILQKQRECPDEVAEAMSTLIYAAARFPDLPELCDLRRIFIDRYGSNIELYVKSEFTKKFQKKPLSKEEKLQKLQEIAKEFSVRWNMNELDEKPRGFVVLKADYVQKPISLHTKNEEQVRSMPKVELNAVNIAKQVQNRQDVHGVSNGDSKYQTEPPRHVELKTAIPPYTTANTKQNSISKYENLGIHERDNVGPERVKYQLKSSNDKPVNLVPPYTKPDLPKNRYHVEETRDGDVDTHYSRQKYDVEKQIRNGEIEEEVRVLHNKGKAANMIPPYVKPRQNDQLSNTEFESPVDVRPRSMRTVRKPAVFDDELSDHRETKEKIVAKGMRTRSEHEEDSAIYYEKVLSKTSSEQKNVGYDEYEIATDRLLAHYSNKGTNGVPRKDRNGVADYKHHVRTASVPLAPATKLEVDKLAARVASLPPGYRGGL